MNINIRGKNSNFLTLFRLYTFFWVQNKKDELYNKWCNGNLNKNIKSVYNLRRKKKLRLKGNEEDDWGSYLLWQALLCECEGHLVDLDRIIICMTSCCFKILTRCNLLLRLSAEWKCFITAPVPTCYSSNQIFPMWQLTNISTLLIQENNIDYSWINWSWSLPL